MTQILAGNLPESLWIRSALELGKSCYRKKVCVCPGVVFCDRVNGMRCSSRPLFGDELNCGLVRIEPGVARDHR